MDGTPVVKIHALVVTAKGLFVDDEHGLIEPDEFLIPVTEDAWLVMRRSATSRRHFEAAGMQLASSSSPRPQAAWQGVLWSRRAAVEADRAIAAFESGAGLTPGLSLRSDDGASLRGA